MTTPLKLQNGSILIIAEAPGGLYNSAQLREIASICDRDLAVVKATEDQRLGIFIKEEDTDQVLQELNEVGLGFRHYQMGIHQPVCCIGELDPEHDQDSLNAALEVTKALSDIDSDVPFRIGINGSWKCYIPAHTYDVSLIGDISGYKMLIGGKTAFLPEMASFIAEGIPPQELPTLLRKVVDIFLDSKEEDETLHEMIQRTGSSQFVEALAPYSQDAADDSDPFSSGGTDLEDSAELGGSTQEDTSSQESNIEPITASSDDDLSQENILPEDSSKCPWISIDVA